MYLVQGALNNSLCRHAVIFLDKLFFKGTAVDSYADRNPSLLCRVYHSLHAISASDISGIDPDLISSMLNRRNSQPVVKVNIGNQRN
mgnify:CR=1 FL=1